MSIELLTTHKRKAKALEKEKATLEKKLELLINTNIQNN